MATYKFEDRNLTLIDPTITISGSVGTKVIDGVPSDEAYADIVFSTASTNYLIRIDGSPKPIDWTMEELSIWVGTQLVKYEI